MEWWGWVLVAWGVGAVVASLVIGRTIALRDRPDDPRWRA